MNMYRMSASSRNPNPNSNKIVLTKPYNVVVAQEKVSAGRNSVICLLLDATLTIAKSLTKRLTPNNKNEAAAEKVKPSAPWQPDNL